MNIVLFVYSCICSAVRDQCIKRKIVGIILTCLTASHVCVCPEKGPGFPTSYVEVLFYVQWFEVTGSLFNYGGSVDYHFLNKRQRLLKGKSIDHSEKPTIRVTQDEEEKKTNKNTQKYTCFGSKHKYRKQDMNPPTRHESSHKT